MKTIVAAALCGVLALAACDGENPFDEEVVETDEDDDDTTGDDDTDDDSSFTVTGNPPTGVTGPTATEDSSIIRYEERNDDGGGYAEDFSYDAATDTFTVDNLAFDGEDAYARDDDVPDIGPNAAYAVYEADISVDDFFDNDAVSQIAPYRAIVGVSTNATTSGAARTSFAIVRTGGYTGYGFGGFVYQRDGEVVLPEVGQATFSGDYAGEMVFNGAGGMLYTQGDMTLEVDFDDPTDATAGVKGYVINREAFNLDGSTVASDNDGFVEDDTDLPLPDIRFVLDGDNGNMSANGEISGEVFSTYTDSEGTLVSYQTGTYYGILAGDTTSGDGGEVVGIMVLEGSDPREALNGATSQETGGFILYRSE